MDTAKETRVGLVYGFAAYGMWGLLPLYWHLLESFGATEVIAHRMVWSLPVALLVLVALRRWSWVPQLLRQPRQLTLVVFAATLIAVNWYVFIWGVTVGRVVETSLGYFINPLVSIAMGVLIFRERLWPMQWVAVGVGGLAVVVLTVAYGRPPWIALVLAFSFASYGLVKKRLSLGGVEGFSAETAVQFLPALGYLLLLGSRGESSFSTHGLGYALLFACSGVATAVPLIFFGNAAVRLPLSTIGLLQYSAPAAMFVLGLTVFHEEMPPQRLTGFLLVWGALVLLSADALTRARRQRIALRAAERAAGAVLQPPEEPAAEREDAPTGTPGTRP